MVRRVVRADVAADRAAVPDLDVGDLRADLAENRPGARLARGHDLRVGGHRADLERAVGPELDPFQLLECAEVDQRVRRARARLHHVDQRLSTRERACAVVLREKPDRLGEG
jgi:hypothetical protein